MIYLNLLLEFFKIGIFSFGGGYATIPFLYHLSEMHEWYSIKELSQMTAIASITPGPVGINVATYAGLKTAGITGAFCATAAEILPSFIFVIAVSKLLNIYSNNLYIKSLISILKPISCALLTAVVIGLIKPEITNYTSMLLLSVLLLLSWKTKKDPIFYMSISALVGILFSFIN